MKISFAPSVMGCEKLKAGTEALLEEMKQIPENLEVRLPASTGKWKSYRL